MPASRKSVSKHKPKPAPSAAKEMPEQCARVILHLADGTQVRGIWTGKKWWAERREVEPVRWEYPKSMIRRQRKAAKSHRGLEKLSKSARKASTAVPAGLGVRAELAVAECTMEGSK